MYNIILSGALQRHIRYSTVHVIEFYLVFSMVGLMLPFIPPLPTHTHTHARTHARARALAHARTHTHTSIVYFLFLYVQRRATRILPELKGFSYGEILESLKLPTMHYRRKRYDLIQFFKIVHGYEDIKVSKGAKIRNRYNQVPHVTQDTNGKVTNSQ